MDLRRLGVGDYVVILGCAAVIVGTVALAWFVGEERFDQGTVSYAVVGWFYAVGKVAAVLAAVAGALTAAKALGGVPASMLRPLGFFVLAVAVAVLVLAAVAFVDKPGLSTFAKNVTDSRDTADLLKIQEQTSAWTGERDSVGYGIGMYVSLLGGLIMVAGGALAALAPPRRAAAPALAPGGAYGYGGVAGPYAQPGFAQQPAPGFGAQGPAAYAPASQPPPPGYAQPGPPPQSPPPGYPPVDPWAQPAPPAPAQAAPPMPAQIAPPVAGPPAASAPGPAPQAPGVSAGQGPAAATGAPAGTAGAARFCSSCGASFTDEASKFCPKCGAARPGIG